MKYCPICKKENLKQEILYNVEVDYCPSCLGIWFDEDELRWAKDEKDKSINWVDVDLWKNPEKFKISRGQRRLCPCCRMPLYEVYYKDSGIVVDVCNLCHGIWLDRLEFKKITEWLKKRSDYEVLNNYSKNLLKQFSQVFVGPDEIGEEIEDFLVVSKLLGVKFLTQYPNISKIILSLPK